jgi:imidazolonepropionase-like amidohydrolase
VQLLSHRLRRVGTMERSLVLWNARVIDGTGASARDGLAVTLVDGRIGQISEVGGREKPAEALDVGGRTALPGLIDAHVHLEGDGPWSLGGGLPRRLEGEEPRPGELLYFVLARTAQVLLEMGITSIRDVGSYDDGGVVLREAVRIGLLDGPRIVSCGRIISATSPGARIFGTMYREADGSDEMRRAVREQLRRGADYVKLMATGARSVVREHPEPAQMTREEIHAIVDEAHRMRVRVAAHAEGLEGTRLAIEECVDTIEHGLSLHRAPELLEKMAERGIVLVPTLSTFHHISEEFADLFAPVLVEQAKRQREEAYKTLLAARRAGVTMAMGEGSGPPGANAIELVRLVDGGLSTLEGITAATQGSARALGLAE